MPDVDFPLHLPFQHRRHHAAYAFLPDAGVRHAKEDEHHDGEKPHQDDGAADDDTETAGHALERLSDRKAEGELAAEPIVLRRLIIGQAWSNRFLMDRSIRIEVSRQIIEMTHA